MDKQYTPQVVVIHFLLSKHGNQPSLISSSITSLKFKYIQSFFFLIEQKNWESNVCWIIMDHCVGQWHLENVFILFIF